MFTRPRIIPVLLIDDRDLIKTVKFGSPTYLGDPVNAVRIFNRKGIDELSVSPACVLPIRKIVRDMD